MIWQTVTAAMLFVAACFTFLVLKFIGEATLMNMIIIVCIYLIIVLVPIIVQIPSIGKYSGRFKKQNN